MFFRIICLSLLSLNLCFSDHGFAAGAYRKATEGGDVVKDKIYPKFETWEFSVPNFGLIMNQSYVNTYLVSGGINYFFSETWGFGLDFTIGSNSDKGERFCIENFFYDPEDEVGSACGDASLLDGADENGNNFPRFGPAYVPVREIDTMIIANMTWTPVYGKQLIFMSGTSYFDLFIEMGMGIANSTFYAKRDILANGNSPRDVFTPETGTAEQIQQAQERNSQIGAQISETSAYGEAGRPDPKSETNLMFNFGIGQKFHFSKRFHVKVYLRNMTLLGTAQGFDNLLAIMGGAGMRL
ncbi:MAG: outer membrane beta-barrel domain-containing protein [Pseudobacteriovorax sp.]|nr:outer membrane beta-barrel domain-containing protein [Pseudobacteriovorax sp.]